MSELLLEIKDLRIQFVVRGGVVKAVDGASFDIKRGKTLGVIGESGCGKSMTARAIMRMVPKPGKTTGEILYHRTVRGPVKANGHQPGQAGANGASQMVEVVNLTD